MAMNHFVYRDVHIEKSKFLTINCIPVTLSIHIFVVENVIKDTSTHHPQNPSIVRWSHHNL